MQKCICWLGWELQDESHRSFCVHRLCTSGSAIQTCSSVRSGCPLESFTWWSCGQSPGEMCGFHYLFEEPFIPVVVIESAGLCWWVLVLTLPGVYTFSFSITKHLQLPQELWTVSSCIFPIYNFLHATKQISSQSEAPGLQNYLIIKYINQ